MRRKVIYRSIKNDLGQFHNIGLKTFVASHGAQPARTAEGGGRFGRLTLYKIPVIEQPLRRLRRLGVFAQPVAVGAE